jgi:hypothetical protein
MHTLDGEQMLMAWERCRERPADEAALALLTLACPQVDGQLASLPLAERNSLLLQLRAMTLGRRIEGFAVCPECGAQLEFVLDARELARAMHAPAAETVGGGLTMRPANTRDVLACLCLGNEQQARSLLLARTLGFEEREEMAGGSESREWLESLSGSSPEVQPETLLERFEQLNASAEIRVQLQCAACQSRPLLDLDVARFLVREMMATARRLMAEIHELARAYGWSERSIATMSAARRSAYLEMLRA